MRILFFVVFFLLLGAFFIVSNQNIKINNDFDFGKFTESYAFWVSGVFENVFQITGNVINSDWLPENKVNSSSTLK